jgi:hypothetical protein
MTTTLFSLVDVVVTANLMGSNFDLVVTTLIQLVTIDLIADMM